MTGNNVFSALAKYNSAIDENYLTEAFVFLVNCLITRERPIGFEILNQVCGEDNLFSPDKDETITISTQAKTEQGVPDIRVSTSDNDKLIYIEVKHDSSVDPEQLRRYKENLKASAFSTTRLILLTKFPVDDSEHLGIPDKLVRWSKVYNGLSSIEARDSVTAYLIEQFKSFLEVKQMSIQRVGWEYINGMPAFNNLINMIESALQSAKIPIYKKSTGWDYKGFLLDNQEYWCGIVYDEPEVVRFQLLNRKSFDLRLADEDKIDYPASESKDKRSILIDLPFEDKYFFSLDKDRQLEEITKFVKSAYAEAQKMRIRDG